MSFREKVTATLLGSLGLAVFLVWTATGPSSSEPDSPTAEAQEQSASPADAPGGPQATVPAEPGPPPTASPTAVETRETSPPATGWYDETEPVAVTFDAADKEHVVRRAEAAWGAFTATAQPEEEWHAGFIRYLTERARHAYETTPIAAVPEQTPAGPGEVIWSSHGLLARVEIPTQDGAVVVHLVRSGSGEDWSVDRFEILSDQGE